MSPVRTIESWRARQDSKDPAEARSRALMPYGQRRQCRESGHRPDPVQWAVSARDALRARFGKLSLAVIRVNMRAQHQSALRQSISSVNNCIGLPHGTRAWRVAATTSRIGRWRSGQVGIMGRHVCPAGWPAHLMSDIELRLQAGIDSL